VPARLKVQVGQLKGGETLTGLDAGVGLGYVF
jgi:hypothetical protein